MRNAGVPEGPSSLQQLLEWPRSILLAIFGSDNGASLRRRRFEALLMHGLVLSTHFSGKGSVEQMFRMLSVMMEERIHRHMCKIDTIYKSIIKANK